VGIAATVVGSDSYHPPNDTSAGGSILPAHHVDVTITTRGRNGGGFRTETILNNIRVLAIDQTIREDEEGRLVQVGQTATLELTPSQVERKRRELADARPTRPYSSAS